MILIRYVLTWSLERTWLGGYNFLVSEMEYPFSFFPPLSPCLTLPSVLMHLVLLVLFSSATGQEDSNPHPSSALSPAFHSHLEARCHSFMYQGLASSTRRTYSCTREKFVNFCFMTGHLSPYGSPSPAPDPLTLCLFAIYLADSLRHSSIKVYLSAVWCLHVDQGFPDPLENCLRLQRVVRGIKHSQGALPSRLRLPVSSNILASR